jgi:hypothetical protein
MVHMIGSLRLWANRGSRRQARDGGGSYNWGKEDETEPVEET